MSDHDVCDNCGSETWNEGHFAVGKLWCRECWAGRKPATPQPVSEEGKRAIEKWIAPRRPQPARQS